jgi:N-methylhydantoinase A
LKRLVALRGAGVASALGLIVAPARADRVATVARSLDAISWPELEALFASLEAEVSAILRKTLPDSGQPRIQRLADIRYVGQASELVVALPPGPYTADARTALVAAFEASYVAAFRRTPPTNRVEIINVRISGTLAADTGILNKDATVQSEAQQRPRSRLAYFPEFREHRPTPVFAREALRPGEQLAGPAIIEEASSTLIVGPGGRVVVTDGGNIVVEIG